MEFEPRPAGEARRGHYYSRALASGAAAIIALGAASSQPSDADTIPRASTGTTTEYAEFAAQNDYPLQPAIAQTAKTDRHCTSIRDKPNNIYMGYGCAETGAKASIIEGWEPEKGWVPAAIVVKGIWKCGFIKQGVLPTADGENGANEAKGMCISYLPRMTTNRYSFFELYNCPALPSGTESCRSGTYFTRVIKKRCRDRRLYYNFATRDASPFNMFASENDGFSDVVSRKKHSAISYRTKVALTSDEGSAVVARNLKNGPRFNWGFMSNECPQKGPARLGGVPTFDSKSVLT